MTYTKNKALLVASWFFGATTQYVSVSTSFPYVKAEMMFFSTLHTVAGSSESYGI